MTDRVAPRPAAQSPPASLYGVGLFAMGYADLYIFLMPLYSLSLGMDAGEVGIIVGARSVLAVFLSIHIGVLIDRFSTIGGARPRASPYLAPSSSSPVFPSPP